MLSKFFIWCSGASYNILKSCPESEHIRQSIIGCFVVLTSIIAFFTSLNALMSIFGTDIHNDSKISKENMIILGSFVWSIMIFNLDRFLVSTTPVELVGEKYKLLKRYILPRFILAATIGVSIGIPLEMYIFETEISKKISENNLQKIKEKIEGEEEKVNIAIGAIRSKYTERVQEIKKNFSVCGHIESEIKKKNLYIRELNRKNWFSGISRGRNSNHSASICKRWPNRA